LGFISYNLPRRPSNRIVLSIPFGIYHKSNLGNVYIKVKLFQSLLGFIILMTYYDNGTVENFQSLLGFIALAYKAKEG